MSEPPVADLVRRAGEGDQLAWDALVDRYVGLVWSVARSFRLGEADAADVVQTTWLRLVEHLGRLQDPDRVGSWLATTASRESLRVLRRSGRERPTEYDEATDVVDEQLPPVDLSLLTAERDALLWQGFERLPPRCRQLLRVLLAAPPPSYAEISAALQMPIGSIGPTRSRCLARLREILSEVGITAATGDL